MCSGVIGDLDADGADELVLPVSYFFDRAYHDSAEHRGELPEGIDPAMYIASGIVVYDLDKRGLKWSTHLDLTTDHVDLRYAALLPASRCATACAAFAAGPRRATLAGVVACSDAVLAPCAGLGSPVMAYRIEHGPGMSERPRDVQQYCVFWNSVCCGTPPATRCWCLLRD